MAKLYNNAHLLGRGWVSFMLQLMLFDSLLSRQNAIEKQNLRDFSPIFPTYPLISDVVTNYTKNFSTKKREGAPLLSQ